MDTVAVIRILLCGILCMQVVTVGVNAIHYKEKRQASPCPTEHWEEYKGYCFLFNMKDRLSFVDARKYCKHKGANLVSIHSADVNAYVSERVVDMVIWIGLWQISSDSPYIWDDGSEVDFTNWRPGQPDNENGAQECVQMHPFPGPWNDVACYHLYAFVCSVKIDSSNSFVSPTTSATSQLDYTDDAGPASTSATGVSQETIIIIVAILGGVIVCVAVVIGVVFFLSRRKGQRPSPNESPTVNYAAEPRRRSGSTVTTSTTLSENYQNTVTESPSTLPGNGQSHSSSGTQRQSPGGTSAYAHLQNGQNGLTHGRNEELSALYDDISDGYMNNMNAN